MEALASMEAITQATMISEAEIERFNAEHESELIRDARPSLWSSLFGRRQPTPASPMPATTLAESGALTPEGVAGALAVADTEPWWRAVHQVIDDLEWETIRAARDSTLQPTACVSHVAAGEGLDMLRKRLKSLREQGLRLPNEERT